MTVLAGGRAAAHRPALGDAASGAWRRRLGRDPSSSASLGASGSVAPRDDMHSVVAGGRSGAPGAVLGGAGSADKRRRLGRDPSSSASLGASGSVAPRDDMSSVVAEGRSSASGAALGVAKSGDRRRQLGRDPSSSACWGAAGSVARRDDMPSVVAEVRSSASGAVLCVGRSGTGGGSWVGIPRRRGVGARLDRPLLGMTCTALGRGRVADLIRRRFVSTSGPIPTLRSPGRVSPSACPQTQTVRPPSV
jgi:hypothetical protein